MTSIIKVIFLEEHHSKFLLESEILFTPMEDHKNIVDNIFVCFFLLLLFYFFLCGRSVEYM